jgi:hypothetical protein
MAPAKRLGVLLAVSACSIAASASASRPSLEVAFQDDRIFVEHAPVLDLEAAYAAIQRLHVVRLRMNVAWARAATADGWDFARWDTAISAASAHGMKVQLTLTGPAPSAATSDHRVGNVRPDPARFAAFASATAEHFRGRVDRYSIWNEPNWGRYLRPRRIAPALYRRLYRAGYAAIKARDPRAEVLLGELAPYGRPDDAVSPLPFLRHALCGVHARRFSRRCVRLRADGLAVHPYTLRWAPDFPGPTSGDVTTGSLPRVATLLQRLRRARVLTTEHGRTLPLFLTEYGYPAHGRAVPPALQASYLQGGWALAAANPSVRQMTHYQLMPDPTSAWDTSLLTDEGDARPAYHALRAWLDLEGRAGRLATAPNA